jgi:DNA ligase-1
VNVPPLIEYQTRPALYLPGPGLFLDPRWEQDFAFVSHAHADHFARHKRVLCSPETGHLLKRRFRLSEEQLQMLPYNEDLEIAGYQLRLLPAGHIFGSAMLHVTRNSNGISLLYTGDYKLRSSLTSEDAQLLPADTLIMETTFGLPHYHFPPREKVVDDILHFVRSTFDEGDQPILLGYSLGKAQEALAILHHHGIPAIAHRTVHEMSVACHEAGLKIPPPPKYKGEIPEGHVLVAPPNAVRSKRIRAISNRRVAMLSGWALNPSARYRYQTDAAFPLSDHADYPELLETVQKVNPRRVLTLHGSTREFASVLRSKGYEAWSIYGDDQIELGLQEADSDPPLVPKNSNSQDDKGELSVLARLLDDISSSSARLRKTSLLANHLRSLEPEALALTTAFLSHRLLGERRPLSLGTAIIRQALLEATKAPLARYRQISTHTADAARSARILLEQYPTPSAQLTSLEEFSQLFHRLSTTPGTLQKTHLLAEAFGKLSPQKAELLVRLLTGGLRAGLKTALLEDAIAEAFDAQAKEVRRAHMLTGDLSATAALARDSDLANATLRVHSPLAPMLASPEPDAESLFAHFRDTETLPLEPKHDGIRAQLHYDGQEATLYSRDLRSLGEEFPEVLTAASTLLAPCILDGEIVAFAEGRQLSFFDLQKRLGRRRHQGDFFLGEAVPVRFVAFDALWLNGKNLLDTPYIKRRQTLEDITLQEPFHCIELWQADSLGEVHEHFKRAISLGHEGLIAKDPDSPYSPGRRGKSWLKLKGVMPTLDCVVIAAQQGHGKRAEVLSDYTFAVRDERSGELLTLGKAYSGLTDEKIEELTEFFKRTRIAKKRRVHEVEPRIVLEIAFDSINPSKRHNSGLALRFPRIKAIRRDKGPDEIDTLEAAKALVKQK